MPYCGCYPDYIDNEDRDQVELIGNDTERFRAVSSNRLHVQTRYQTEPEIQDVERDKEEENYAGDSLNEIEPVSWVRVGQVIRSSLNRDYQAVYSMIDQRYKDAADLHKQNVRNRLEIFHSVIKLRCA